MSSSRNRQQSRRPLGPPLTTVYTATVKAIEGHVPVAARVPVTARATPAARAPAGAGDPPAGCVIVAQTRLDELRATIEAGREAFLEVNKGKYLPSNRAAWAAEYDRDPVATQAHFATAPKMLLAATVPQALSEATDVTETFEYQNWSM